MSPRSPKPLHEVYDGVDEVEWRTETERRRAKRLGRLLEKYLVGHPDEELDALEQLLRENRGGE